MRTHTTQDDKVFAGRAPSALQRVSVKDAGGTFRDLTALYGWDFVDGVEIERSVDQPAASCVLTLRREIFNLALSTEIAGSRINQLGGGARLLDLNRDVKVEVQVVPDGDPAGATWTQEFYGRIDKTNSASDPMVVECSDLVARLQQAWIKTDRRYGIWDAARRVISGTVVLKSDDDPTTPTYGYWQAQSTFTTGATEPAWPAGATPGVTTIADNTGSWICIARPGSGTNGPRGTPMETAIQQLLDDNLGVGAWTLYCPISPAFEMNPWDQQKESLFTALQKCADLTAWNLEWRYTDNPPNTFGGGGAAPNTLGWALPPGGVAGWYLTLYDPKRASVASAYTLTPDVYDDITTEFSRDIQYIRNDIEVSYLQQAVLDAAGNPTRTSVFATDATSQAAYGDLYMGVAEGTSGGIYTAAQANALATAICSDLAQTLVQTAVRTPFAWWPQLNDVITLNADNLRSDAALTMAISSLTHIIKNGEKTTEWGLRGKPSSRHKGWHDRMAMSGVNGGPIRTIAPRKVANITTVQTLNGARIKFQVPTRRQVPRYSHTELHLSTNNGFAPSSATLVAVAKTGHFDLAPTLPGLTGALTPGTTYYAQLRHVDEAGNVVSTSSQFSFVAGSTTTVAKLANNSTFAVSAGLQQIVPFDTDVLDPNNLFNTVTHTFTPPAAGQWYLVSASVQISGVSPGDSLSLLVFHTFGAGDIIDAVGQFSPTLSVAGLADYITANVVVPVQSQSNGPGVCPISIKIFCKPATTPANWTFQKYDLVGGIGGCIVTFSQLMA